jgi:hypothetical protein
MDRHAGFYAGLTPAVIGITPYMGFNFLLYDVFKKLLKPYAAGGEKSKAVVTTRELSASSSSNLQKVIETLKNGACGGVAGGISKVIVYPLVSYVKLVVVTVLLFFLHKCDAVIEICEDNLHT